MMTSSSRTGPAPSDRVLNTFSRSRFKGEGSRKLDHVSIEHGSSLEPRPLNLEPGCGVVPQPAKRGFSFIELILVISLLGIFLGTVYESVIVGLRAANAADERADIRQQLTNALDLLIREVSLASRVDNAEDERLQFDADLDGDGTTENDINYQVSSGALQRVYNGTTVTLIRVASVDLNYVDSSGANLTTPVSSQATRDTIRVAEMTMTATNDQETLSLADAVYLRNN